MSTKVQSSHASNWRDQVNEFNSDAYIKGEKKIELPKDFEERMASALGDSEQCRGEGREVAQQIKDWVDWINEELSSDDLSDAEKRSFMHKFCNQSSDDFDSALPGTVGRIIAAVVSGDKHAWDEMFHDALGTNLFAKQASLIDDDRIKTFKEWREANGIQRPTDTASKKAFKDELGAEAAARANYGSMTIDDFYQKSQEHKAEVAEADAKRRAGKTV